MSLENLANAATSWDQFLWRTWTSFLFFSCKWISTSGLTFKLTMARPYLWLQSDPQPWLTPNLSLPIPLIVPVTLDAYYGQQGYWVKGWGLSATLFHHEDSRVWCWLHLSGCGLRSMWGKDIAEYVGKRYWKDKQKGDMYLVIHLCSLIPMSTEATGNERPIIWLFMLILA